MSSTTEPRVATAPVDDRAAGPAEPRPLARAPWRHRLLAAVCRAAAALLRLLPARLAYGLADVLAFVVVRPLIAVFERKSARKGRGIARNLAIAFREDADERFVRRVFSGYARHLCRSLVDLCRLPLIDARNVRRHVLDNDSIRRLLSVFEETTGTVGVTGHIGCVDMSGHTGSLLGSGPLHTMMRPMPIETLDRLLRELRGSGGQVLLTKWGAIREARRLLTSGHNIAMVVDENEKREKSAVFAPFLGTPAATPTSAALLHLRTRGPISIATMHPAGLGRWQMHLWDLIRYESSGDHAADMQRVCTRINRALSAAIRAYPEQWLWGMRRFATRPPGERPGADGLPPIAPGARQAEEELARAVLARDAASLDRARRSIRR